MLSWKWSNLYWSVIVMDKHWNSIPKEMRLIWHSTWSYYCMLGRSGDLWTYLSILSSPTELSQGLSLIFDVVCLAGEREGESEGSKWHCSTSWGQHNGRLQCDCKSHHDGEEKGTWAHWCLAAESSLINQHSLKVLPQTQLQTLQTMSDGSGGKEWNRNGKNSTELFK